MLLEETGVNDDEKVWSQVKVSVKSKKSELKYLNSSGVNDDMKFLKKSEVEKSRKFSEGPQSKYEVKTIEKSESSKKSSMEDEEVGR